MKQKQIIGNQNRKKIKIHKGDNSDLIALANKVKDEDSQPDNLETKEGDSPSNSLTSIVESDFIHFDQPYPFDIAIAESHQNMKWFDQNKAVLSKGLYVANLLEFMTMFQGVVDSYKNNSQLFDAAGNPLDQSTIDYLYYRLTEFPGKGFYCNLNGLIKKSGDNCYLRELVGISKNVVEDKEKQVIISVKENCYVDFNCLTSVGIPIKKSSNQCYKEGENIFYCSPIDGYITRFNNYDMAATISFRSNDSYTDNLLGVLEVRKNK